MHFSLIRYAVASNLMRYMQFLRTQIEIHSKYFVHADGICFFSILFSFNIWQTTVTLAFHKFSTLNIPDGLPRNLKYLS